MAKEYAYYIEGNKVAIVERDTAFTNNVDSREYGPGVSRSYWKSPLSSVTDGLEIKYAYSPVYQTYKDNVPFSNVFMASGWTVINGYLTFVSSRNGGTNGVQNWSASTSGTEGQTGADTSDYILVTGSARWNGIHKVQTAGGDGNALNGGMLITHTRANSLFPTLGIFFPP